MSILSEFRRFALRGNFIDLAIGFTVGAAFTTVAKSAVDDLISPLVAYLSGGSDFSNLFTVLNHGDPAGPYPSLTAAQTAGALTINWGIFINSIIAFVLVAIVMFIIIRGMNKMEEALEAEFGDDAAQPDEQEYRKCPYCRTQIHVKASRCPNCTSELEASP